MYYLFTVCVIEIRSCEIVFSKSKMCMHSMCGSQASYQVSRANQLASGCGTQSISDVLADVSVPEATPGYLADGEDITRLLLQTGKTEGPALNPCSVQMPKAAVLSFHTWHERAPGIVGILLGSKKKTAPAVSVSPLWWGVALRSFLQVRRSRPFVPKRISTSVGSSQQGEPPTIRIVRESRPGLPVFAAKAHCPLLALWQPGRFEYVYTIYTNICVCIYIYNILIYIYIYIYIYIVYTPSLAGILSMYKQASILQLSEGLFQFQGIS